MHSIKLHVPLPAGRSIFNLLNPNVDHSFLSQKCINTDSLMKSSPIIFKISHYQGRKVDIPACLTPLWPWMLTFWTQNLKCLCLSQNAAMLKVWWKYVQYFSRHCINNVWEAWTDRLAGSQTASKQFSSPHYVGWGVKEVKKRKVKVKPVRLVFLPSHWEKSLCCTERQLLHLHVCTGKSRFSQVYKTEPFETAAASFPTGWVPFLFINQQR